MASSGDVTINLTPNDPPKITALAPQNVDSSKSNIKISDVAVTDTENDTILCVLGTGIPFNLKYINPNGRLFCFECSFVFSGVCGLFNMFNV